MLFNSYIFVLLFLPLCVFGYYCFGKVNNKIANVFLLGMSIWFYGYFNKWYLILILSSILINFFIYKLFGKFQIGSVRRKAVIIAGVAINIGILIYFKYMDFFISTVNMIFGSNYKLLEIVLPLGISFFTFQQISFIVDAYKGEVDEYSILEYACYVTFFPQLVAGPIVTHDELVPQLESVEKKQVNWENIYRGIFIFTMGMSKKVLLADTFGNAVNAGYDNIESLNSISAILVMLAYTIQIYFDFSGYCDMAIGIGYLFNIQLPTNFNSPYKANNINEFWDRWHMTLTRFFTRYVYIPLGGNRKGKARTYLNIFIVFFLSGFWHGAGFTFILWGIGHGIACIIHRATKNIFDKIPKIINWIITFTLVNFLWVLFKSSTVSQALLLYKRIFTGGLGGVDESIAQPFKLFEIDFVVDRLPIIKNILCFDLIGFLVVAMLIILLPKNNVEKVKVIKPNLVQVVVLSILMVWCIVSFAGKSTFLYFNF